MIRSICKLLMASTILVLTCNPQEVEESCSPFDDPQATRYIQVTYPSAGDTVSLSNPLPVQFKIKQVKEFSGKMNIGAVLTVNKKPYEMTGTETLPVPYKGEFTCAEILWNNISSDQLSLPENDLVSAQLKVYQYGAMADIYYTTGVFYIRK